MRAREKRNKPLTQAQQRKLYCNYLKNREGYTLKQLKGFKFEVIKDMFDKAFKRKLDENIEAEVNDDQEEAEMKNHMEIILDDEVAIDAIPTKYLINFHMLQTIDREDFENPMVIDGDVEAGMVLNGRTSLFLPCSFMVAVRSRNIYWKGMSKETAHLLYVQLYMAHRTDSKWTVFRHALLAQEDVVVAMKEYLMMSDDHAWVYGGEARISALRKLFPLMDDKKSLASDKEQAEFEGKASLLAAVDYYVSTDIFISSSPGNKHNAMLCMVDLTRLISF
ncbi:hypothetical protein Tco_0906796 [Tanacetum coccineum]|uniref:Uncharacterized protein n=1 Tax=Tanacetum coccineum TaxID=301880 RepID=A0ABQ5CKW3_9ASTR